MIELFQELQNTLFSFGIDKVLTELWPLKDGQAVSYVIMTLYLCKLCLC